MISMRIAFAMINCNRRDGSARAVNEVAERLARRGHDVHLYARRAEDIDLDLVHWHRVPGPGWPEIADFWSYHTLVNRSLHRHDYDIVHSIGCNTLRANVVTIQNIQPAKRAILSRFAATEHISPARRFTRWLYLRVTSNAEYRLYTGKPGRPRVLFLPVSRGVEAELRDHYVIGDAPVRIVPNAADTSIFHPVDPASREKWRSAAGFAQHDIVAIFSGGEWARKGLDLAIRALSHSLPSLKLFIAGDDPDRERFRTLALSSGVADRVVFGGFRSDIPLALASSDIFLFPSHYEAFSLAVIEAAACGLPILASSINGTEDFIQPGITGDFVDHDPRHIASLLNQWASDPLRRTQAGQAATRLVQSQYTWDRVTDLTEEAYRSILPS